VDWRAFKSGLILLLWWWRLKALAFLLIHALFVVAVFTAANGIAAFALCRLLVLGAPALRHIGLRPFGFASRASLATVFVMFVCLRISLSVRDRYWTVLRTGEGERKVRAALRSRRPTEVKTVEVLEAVPLHDWTVSIAARVAVSLHRRRARAKAIWRIGAEAVAPALALIVSKGRSVTVSELRPLFPSDKDLGRVLLCLCAVKGVRLERRGRHSYVCLSSHRLLMLLRRRDRNAVVKGGAREFSAGALRNRALCGGT
jgi:hypothetical protein